MTPSIVTALHSETIKSYQGNPHALSWLEMADQGEKERGAIEHQSAQTLDHRKFFPLF